MAAADNNKALACRLLTEVWQHGNLAVLDALMAPSSGYAARGDHRQSREEMRTAVQVYRAAFPDLQLHIDDVVAEDDTVVVRWRSEGTHQGPLQGVAAAVVLDLSPAAGRQLLPLVQLAPTGHRAHFAGVAFFRVSDGQVQDVWMLVDEAELLRQLGALPVTQPTGHP